MIMAVGIGIILSLVLGYTCAYAYDEDYHRGYTAFRKGDFRSALERFKEFVARTPDAGAYYLLGYASYQLGDHAAAQRYFDQAYLIDPEIGLERIPEHFGLAPKDSQRVREILELSGTRQQAAAIAGVVISGIPYIRSYQKRPDHRNFLGILNNALSAERLYPPIVRYFEERYHPQHADTFLKWLQSALGRKMTAIEIESMQIDAVRDANERQNEYYQSLDRNRQQLCARLEKALMAGDLNFAVMAGMFRSFVMGMQASLPEHERMSTEEFGRFSASVTQLPKEPFVIEAVVSIAYVYRTLTDHEIADAITFYETETGRWMSATFRDAVAGSLAEAARAIGEELAAPNRQRKITA